MYTVIQEHKWPLGFEHVNFSGCEGFPVAQAVVRQHLRWGAAVPRLMKVSVYGTDDCSCLPRWRKARQSKLMSVVQCLWGVRTWHSILL